MAEVHGLFQDARYNRAMLERIVAVSLAEINGRMALRLDLSTGDLHPDWLNSVPTYRFVIDNGARIIEGKHWHIFRHEPEPPYFVEVRLRNLSTGANEETLGDWTTLQVVIQADGNVEKHFEVKKTS
jgi:hypothetical protein